MIGFVLYFAIGFALASVMMVCCVACAVDAFKGGAK